MTDPAGINLGADMTRLRVGLGNRGYDILIGDGAAGQLAPALALLAPGRKVIIVSDPIVAPLHLEAVAASLHTAGHEVISAQIPAGEASKSFTQYAALCEAVLDGRLERDDILVALGGGVVGDLAGFVAGSVRRGMRFVQMPTSLLAQVDASVGGKTGINAPQGKNLVGLFNQPILVLADTAILNTLPPRQMRAGYAEVVKYGLLGDKHFFNWLQVNHEAIFAGGPERVTAIARSCAYKAEIVAEDEHEHGRRALLNLGHTFGHALERASGYSDRLIHGEAVAIGMVMAFDFSARLNLCSPDAGKTVARHLRTVGLPTRLADILGELPSPDTLMAGIAQDKKVRRGALTFILARAIGEAFVAPDVPTSEVQGFLSQSTGA